MGNYQTAYVPIYWFLIFLHQEPKAFFGLRANSLYDIFVFNVHIFFLVIVFIIVLFVE